MKVRMAWRSLLWVCVRRGAYVELRHVLDDVAVEGSGEGVVLDPGVLECLLRGDALRGCVREHLRDESLRLLRDALPVGVVERVLPGLDCLHDLDVGGTVEGRVSAQEDVQDDSARPHVALLVVVAEEDFGSDVVGSAVLLVHLFSFLVLHGDSKVDDFELCVGLLGLDEEVLGFEVAVDDAFLVAVVDRRQDLAHVLCCLFLGERVELLYFVEELSSRAVLLDEVVVFVVLVELDEFDDVGMVETLEDAHLGQQFLSGLLLHGRLLDHLHGADDLGLLVRDETHLAVRTLAQHLPHLVVVRERSFFRLDELLGRDHLECLALLRDDLSVLRLGRQGLDRVLAVVPGATPCLASGIGGSRSDFVSILVGRVVVEVHGEGDAFSLCFVWTLHLRRLVLGFVCLRGSRIGPLLIDGLVSRLVERLLSCF
jgi:hypothetical protein